MTAELGVLRRISSQSECGAGLRLKREPKAPREGKSRFLIRWRIS